MRLLAAALVCAASAVTTAQGRSQGGTKTSPSTGATLASTTLAPNYALKSLIAGWKAQRSRARD